MKDLFTLGLPVPPALVYLLHQFKEHGIHYELYGEIVDAEMVFVDIDRSVARHLEAIDMPGDWSLISPHYLSHRALASGHGDAIGSTDNPPEAVVIAFGGEEAKNREFFDALCEQVKYLRQQCPSRLVYHNTNPPSPMEIHELIALLKAGSETKS